MLEIFVGDSIRVEDPQFHAKYCWDLEKKISSARSEGAEDFLVGHTWKMSGSFAHKNKDHLAGFHKYSARLVKIFT